MAANNPGQLIFGRYSREQCGLPPAEPESARRARLLRRGFLAAAALVLAGWLLGLAMARWRAFWLSALPARVFAAGPEEVDGLLAVGRMYAASQPANAAMARGLVAALAAAAERSPRRMGYYGSAGAILSRLPAVPGGPPDEAFAAALSAAGIWAELGRFEPAFARLADAEKALAKMPETPRRRSLRLLLVNMQAYLLATAPAGAGRNPGRALRLAQLLLSSRDALAPGVHASDSAAFLDTLATAWFAAGEAGEAARTQSLALGLADSEGLDVYLKHYDEFSGAKPSPAAPGRETFASAPGGIEAAALCRQGVLNWRSACQTCF